jgi:hypothetical protein
MHAPDDEPVKRSTNEIGAEVVELLEPLRPEWTAAEIPGRVYKSIEALQADVPEYFEREAIKTERERARGLIDTIAELERQLRNAPRELKLDFPIDDLHPDSHPARLFTELNYLRERCETIIADTLIAGRKDQVKRSCAQVALHFIRIFSTQRAACGSDGSTFPRITALIYEAVTGEEKASGFRALCKDMLDATAIEP